MQNSMMRDFAAIGIVQTANVSTLNTGTAALPVAAFDAEFESIGYVVQMTASLIALAADTVTVDIVIQGSNGVGFASPVTLKTLPQFVITANGVYHAAISVDMAQFNDVTGLDHVRLLITEALGGAAACAYVNTGLAANRRPAHEVAPTQTA